LAYSQREGSGGFVADLSALSRVGRQAQGSISASSISRWDA
jgi:hypothetical protein